MGFGCFIRIFYFCIKIEFSCLKKHLNIKPYNTVTHTQNTIMATFQNVLDAVAQCQIMHDNKVAVLKAKIKQMAETVLQANARAESLERENRKLWKSLRKKEKKLGKLRKSKEDKFSTVVSSASRAAITTYVDYADLTQMNDDAVKLENDKPMEIKELEDDAVVSEMQAQQEAELEGEAEVDAEFPVSEEVDEEEVEESEVVEEEEVDETKEVEVEEEVDAAEEEEEVEVEETEEVEEEVEETEEVDAAEEEVYMVNIDGKDYYTTNEKSGMIYAVDAEGDVGEEVGYYEDGEPGFYEEE